MTKRLDSTVTATERTLVAHRDSDKDLLMGSITSGTAYKPGLHGSSVASAEEMLHAPRDSAEMTGLKVSGLSCIIEPKEVDIAQTSGCHGKSEEVRINTIFPHCVTFNKDLDHMNIVTTELCEAHSDLALERKVCDNGEANTGGASVSPVNILPSSGSSSLLLTKHLPPPIIEGRGSGEMQVKKRKRGRPPTVRPNLPDITMYPPLQSEVLPLSDSLLLKPPLLGTFEPTASDGICPLDPYHSSSHPQLPQQLQQELQSSVLTSLSLSTSIDHLPVCDAPSQLIDLALPTHPLCGPGIPFISIPKVVSLLDDFPGKNSYHSMNVTGLVDYSSDENTEQEQCQKLKGEMEMKDDLEMRTDNDGRKIWDISRIIDNERDVENSEIPINEDEMRDLREIEEDGEEFLSGITTIIGTPSKQTSEVRQRFTGSESDIGSGTESGSDTQVKSDEDVTSSHGVSTLEVGGEEYNYDDNCINSKSRSGVKGIGSGDGSQSHSKSNSQSQNRFSGRKGSRSERPLSRYSMQYDREEK